MWTLALWAFSFLCKFSLADISSKAVTEVTDFS
uniref:Interleukin-31 receptor subunit alpha short peptide n=1 Tax=Mus musculus TaxID=10090 RepID=A0A7I6N2K7_MOUSE|nr:interleukin-31 receptor subunit alpha short peptide [Mus musculus]